MTELFVLMPKMIEGGGLFDGSHARQKQHPRGSRKFDFKYEA